MEYSGKVPKLFICGFTKCATSSLHTWLTYHPNIVEGKRKELEFLYDETSYFYKKNFNIHKQGIEGYKCLFPQDRKNSIFIDSTPAYAYHDTALKTISQLKTEKLCVFIIRDPIDHILSTYHYFHNNKQYISKNITLDNFLEMLISKENKVIFKQDHLKNALEYAQFSYWIERWQSTLGKEDILIYEMKNLLQNPKVVVNQIVSRLNLATDIFDDYSFPAENETYYVKSRTLQALNTFSRKYLPQGEVYKKLRNLYRSLNTTKEKPKTTDSTQILISQLKTVLYRETEYVNKFQNGYTPNKKLEFSS